MNHSVLLRDWDNNDRIVRLDIAVGLVTFLSDDPGDLRETAGFISQLGRTQVIAYMLSGRLVLHIDDERFTLPDSSMSLSVVPSWPYVVALICRDGRSIKLREFAPVRLLLARLDLTYDSVDATNDFFLVWLLDRLDRLREQQEKKH